MIRMLPLALLFFTSSIAWGQNVSLTLREGQNFTTNRSFVELDTLIMEDQASITFTKPQFTLSAKYLKIKRNCTISGKGTDGKPGKKGRKGLEREDGQQGGNGGKGKDGGTLNLVANYVEIGSLTIDLRGGDGGTGGDGGQGGVYRCQCTYNKTTEKKGTNGGKGGNGGQLNLNIFASNSSNWRQKIQVLTDGGQAGVAGIGGAPGEIIAKQCEDGTWAEAVDGESGTGGGITKNSTGNAGSAQNFSFPFPPPKASATLPEIPITLKTGGNFGQVEAQLKRSFQSCGYEELKYYAIPNGFAVVTGIEQIEPTGKPLPLPDRWSNKTKFTFEKSLAGIFEALFTSKEGFFRIIVFAFTSSDISTTRERISKKDALAWFESGWFSLPGKLKKTKFSNDHTLTAFIYEFKVDENENKPALSLPSNVPAKSHLVAAGIWRSLNLEK